MAAGNQDSLLLDNSRSFERVDLFLSANNVPMLHTFNVTDPFAVVYFLDQKHNTLMGVGNTEVVYDSCSPEWTKAVTVDYFFEQVQEIYIHVYHCTGESFLNEIERHEFIGEVKFTLSSILRADSQKLELAIENHQRPGVYLGEVVIRAEAQSNTRDMLTVRFSGQKLVNKEGFFGRSDPFLEISRINEDMTYTPVWRSTKINSTLNPKWPEVTIPLVTLCNGDQDRELLIEIWDHQRNGKHCSMGRVETTVRMLLESRGAPMPVIEKDRLLHSMEAAGGSKKRGTWARGKLHKKVYTNSGFLIADRCRIEHKPTLSDFIMGGCEISLVVGIDYTGSNGDPKEATSLHYVDPTLQTWNIYQQAIYSVGNVLEPYDTDRMYSVFGFGARVKSLGTNSSHGSLVPAVTSSSGSNVHSAGSYFGNQYHNNSLSASNSSVYTTVRHCFPIYGGSNQVSGIHGILQAYQDGLQHVLLSGPTLLAPIITATAQLAANDECTQVRQKYHILLLITDGVVNDMEATKLAIIQASKQPISIIIVGVGPADFKDMDALDSDRQLLQVNKQIAERDIVQFIPYVYHTIYILLYLNQLITSCLSFLSGFGRD